MTGEIYKVLMVDGKQVKCIDEIDGFTLEIDGQKYNVYDEDDGTHIDMLIDDDEKEYIGKINDKTASEEKVARFILSFWNGDDEEFTG